MGALNQITGRQRVLAALEHRCLDRVPITETHFWPETIQRWRAEGLPEDADPLDFFDLEFVPLRYEGGLMREEKVLEEDDRVLVRQRSDGTVRREWKAGSAVPQTLEYPLNSEEDWSRIRDEMLANPDARIQGMKDACDRHRQAGRFVAFASSEPGFYCLRLMSLETFAEVLLEQPRLLCDIMATMVQQFRDAYDRALALGMEPDGVMIYGDLCYRNGPFLSPRHYRELVAPYQRAIAEHARKPVIWHCDGDIRLLLPFVADAGITCMQPVEARAGNDVRLLKKQYGDELAFMGNISVEALSAGGAAMEEEILSKVTAAKEGGGYIFHSDHSVPPTVSLANYTRAVELARECGAYP
jgi:uroporphyrinogen decarboxylase